MRRIASLILASLMVVSLFAACSDGESGTSGTDPGNANNNASSSVTYPLVEETYTLTMWFPASSTFTSNPLIDLMSDTKMIKTYEELMNVAVEFVSPSEDMAAESLNIMLAGSDYTDVIGGFGFYYTGSVEAAVGEDIIVDLDGYVKDYMPNYYGLISEDNGYAKQMYTDNGILPGLYCIKDPAQDAFLGPVIRDDLLEKYSLNTPVTFEDLENVLTVFVNNGEGKLGLMSTGFMDLFNSSYTFSAGYEIGNTAEPYINKDGEAIFTPTTDNWHDYLKMITDWNEKGLVYTDWSTLSIGTLAPAVTSGEVAVFDGLCGFIDEYEQLSNGTISLTGFAFPKKSEDQTLHLRKTSEDVLVDRVTAVTTSCEDLRVVLAYFDYWYTEEGMLYSTYGEQGVTWDYDEDGNPRYTEYVTNNPDGYTPSQIIGLYGVGGVAGLNDPTASNVLNSEKYLEAQSIWSVEGDDYVYPFAVSMTAEESSDYFSIINDILTYVSEYAVRVINGDDDLDATWNDYVSRIEGMNVAQATAIKQAALNRYLSR